MSSTCSLTTAAFNVPVVRVSLAAKVKSELFWSSTVIPALYASGLVLSLPSGTGVLVAAQCHLPHQEASPKLGLKSVKV